MTKEKRGGLGDQGRQDRSGGISGREETDVIDVGGCTVVPGFIDYHIHTSTQAATAWRPTIASSGVTAAVDRSGTCRGEHIRDV